MKRSILFVLAAIAVQTGIWSTSAQLAFAGGKGSGRGGNGGGQNFGHQQAARNLPPQVAKPAAKASPRTITPINLNASHKKLGNLNAGNLAATPIKPIQPIQPIGGKSKSPPLVPIKQSPEQIAGNLQNLGIPSKGPGKLPKFDASQLGQLAHPTKKPFPPVIDPGIGNGVGGGLGGGFGGKGQCGNGVVSQFCGVPAGGCHPHFPWWGFGLGYVLGNWNCGGWYYPGGGCYYPSYPVVYETPIVVTSPTPEVTVNVPTNIDVDVAGASAAATPESAPAADAAKRPQIPAGSPVTLNGNALTEKPGQVILQLGDVALPAEVKQWKNDQVACVLPLMAVAKPVPAQLHTLRADGTVASTLDFDLLPPSPPATASK